VVIRKLFASVCFAHFIVPAFCNLLYIRPLPPSNAIEFCLLIQAVAEVGTRLDPEPRRDSIYVGGRVVHAALVIEPDRIIDALVHGHIGLRPDRDHHCRGHRSSRARSPEGIQLPDGPAETGWFMYLQTGLKVRLTSLPDAGIGGRVRPVHQSVEPKHAAGMRDRLQLLMPAFRSWIPGGEAAFGKPRCLRFMPMLHVGQHGLSMSGGAYTVARPAPTHSIRQSGWRLNRLLPEAAQGCLPIRERFRSSGPARSSGRVLHCHWQKPKSGKGSLQCRPGQAGRHGRTGWGRQTGQRTPRARPPCAPDE